jgi:6-phosphofructokinase 1
VDRAIISEVPFNAHRLAELVMTDKKLNPSNYAMLTISEGARLEEGEIIQIGEADAYGHQKLGGIGQITGEALKQLTHTDIVHQQIAYLMRAGAPDSLDRMVAISYANLAVDLIMKRVYGIPPSARDLHRCPAEHHHHRPEAVDVRELYDEEQYRPKVRHVMANHALRKWFQNPLTPDGCVRPLEMLTYRRMLRFESTCACPRP